MGSAGVQECRWGKKRRAGGKIRSSLGYWVIGFIWWVGAEAEVRRGAAARARRSQSVLKILMFSSHGRVESSVLVLVGVGG